MAILRIGGMPVSGALRFGGMPLSGAERVMGLGPLPAATTPVAGIPTPTRYWALDGGLYDLVNDWYISPDQGAIEYVTDGAVYGQAARSQLTGVAWIGLAYADYGSPSRAVVSAWLRRAGFSLGGSLYAGESAGVRTLVVRESSSLPTSFPTFALRIGSEDGTLVGQADEVAIWLDPPAEWTQEAALAALSQGDGVVWRDCQWQEVAAV